MAQGRLTVDYSDDKAIVTIQSGNYSDQATFGPTDYDNIAFYGRDKFKELNAKREADIAGAPVATDAPAEETTPPASTDGTATPDAAAPADITAPTSTDESDVPADAGAVPDTTPAPAPATDPAPATTNTTENLSKAVVDVVYLSDRSYGGLKLEYEGGELFLENKGSFEADMAHAKETADSMGRKLLYGDSVIQYSKNLDAEKATAPVADVTQSPAQTPDTPETGAQTPTATGDNLGDPATQQTSSGDVADNNGATSA